MPFSLHKDKRIRKSGDYRRVYGQGVKLVGRFVLVFNADAREGFTRVGITVSSKVGGAVVRNRVRRRIREAVKSVLDDGPVPRDIVIVATRKAAAAELSEFKVELARLVGKGGGRK